VGQAARKIFFILGALSGAATLALAFVVLQREAAIHALLLQQAASRESTDLEVRRSLSQLSERVDGIAATFSREIAEGSSGTQGVVRRLQRRLAADISTVRGSLAEMAVVLNRPAPAADSFQGIASSADPRADSSEKPTTAAAASPSADGMEQDFALSQALRRAKEHFGEREFAEAARILSPFSLQQVKDPEVRLYLAASRFCANPSDSSIQAGVEQDLRAVLKEETASLVALETMGSLCMEQGRWTEALEWLAQVIALKPSDVDVLEKCGACALAAGDLPRAKSCLEKAAAIRPADANLWYEAGGAFAASGETEEALARFEQCLALEPSHRGARVQAARCLQQLGRYAEATELADRAPGAAGQQE
jgi:tetratricopeptide (TPR) repeat protein